MCRHLDARHLLVGCDAFYEDEYDGGGGGGDIAQTISSTTTAIAKKNQKYPQIPRINPWAPNLKRVEELNPTLIICAYDATADALRALGPRWEQCDATKKESSGGGGGGMSFEVAVLRCPMGKGAVSTAAAQFAEVARLARARPEAAERAAATLTEGLAKLRVRAERELGGADQNHRDADWPRRKKPWIFIEADPDLYLSLIHI